ncbi:DUF192 domain-containing protein [Arenimonas oryziterrae]|uniref:ACR family protein n=1 Tax=Arenimonas oryziterrae DSM 21050 = YC6267 TaxID=1121015 RepID=A0A091BDM5_9GAMM|nr:DUF192 domain-containing protein [Arenimonas oryziterrae]KFN42475.1 hypothetical protein N789_14050 [Arenimonas oryziterrae DSM 21050 = YC6267]
MLSKRHAALCFSLATLLVGCASAGGGAWVELKGKRFAVEIADDDAERERGLMFRDTLAVDHGMLFVHDTEEPLSYWMKNTKIPLDILYFDHDRKLVSAQKGVPPCSGGDRCPPYASEGSALYVLELNAGQADALGVKAGDELTFGPEIVSKK